MQPSIDGHRRLAAVAGAVACDLWHRVPLPDRTHGRGACACWWCPGFCRWSVRRLIVAVVVPSCDRRLRGRTEL